MTASPRHLLLSCSLPVLQSITRTRGIVPLVGDPSMALALIGLTSEVVPQRASRIKKFFLDANPLVDLVLLQSLTRAKPSNEDGRAVVRPTDSPGVWFPFSAWRLREATGPGLPRPAMQRLQVSSAS